MKVLGPSPKKTFTSFCIGLPEASPQVTSQETDLSPNDPPKQGPGDQGVLGGPVLRIQLPHVTPPSIITGPLNPLLRLQEDGHPGITEKHEKEWKEGIKGNKSLPEDGQPGLRGKLPTAPPAALCSPRRPCPSPGAQPPHRPSAGRCRGSHPARGLSSVTPSQRGQPSTPYWPQTAALGSRRSRAKVPEGGREATHLDVLVQNPAHSREGAIRPLLPDDPALGSLQLLWVDEDEAARLGKGLQDKGREPEIR